jgi:hypothetical protein
VTYNHLYPICSGPLVCDLHEPVRLLCPGLREGEEHPGVHAARLKEDGKIPRNSGEQRPHPLAAKNGNYIVHTLTSGEGEMLYSKIKVL